MPGGGGAGGVGGAGCGPQPGGVQGRSGLRTLNEDERRVVANKELYERRWTEALDDHAV